MKESSVDTRNLSVNQTDYDEYYVEETNSSSSADDSDEEDYSLVDSYDEEVAVQHDCEEDSNEDKKQSFVVESPEDQSAETGKIKLSSPMKHVSETGLNGNKGALFELEHDTKVVRENICLETNLVDLITTELKSVAQDKE